MATITPTDLRTKQQSSAFYLSVFHPATLLTASVNNGSIARGARTIAYDGGSGSGFATIESFQLLEVDTTTGTKLIRLKSITGSQSGGTITVDENDIDWGDNDTIRVKHFYPVVIVPPSIRSQIFYKFFDTAYSNQNSLVNPVAIIGSHRIGVLSAGSVAFSLNSSSSYAIAQGASISSRVWSCVHNGGGTSGISFSSTTAANPTLTITVAGEYWLKCIVTDSNGKTQSTWRAIFVYASADDAYKDFAISGLTGDWSQSGWQCSISVTGDVTLSDFPDGALAVIWHVNKFNGVAGYIDLWGTAGQQIVMAGYIRRDQDNDNIGNGMGQVSFSFTTPEAVFDNASEMGSISINAVASPTKWYQYASWLTVGRGVHHLLKWHSSVLETMDVLGLTDNTLGVKTCDFTEPTLLQMCNTLGYTRGHFAKLVSSRLGRLHFVTDSQMLNTAARAALDTVFTISTSDISGVIDVVRQPEANTALADLDGFSFNGSTSTPFISIIPGYRESGISYGLPGYRGAGASSTKSQVLSSQTDSNEKVGRVFAVANNNPQELRFTTPGNYLGAFDIVPSIGWYEWGISDGTLKRGVSLNGKLLLCRNVSHQINHTAGTIQTSIVLEPEAQGPDGIQGNYPTSYPSRVGVTRTPTWNSNSASNSTRFIAAGWRDAVGSINDKIIAGKINSFAIGGEYTYLNDASYIRLCNLQPFLGLIAYFDNDTTLPMVATVTVSSPTTVSVNAPTTVDVSAFIWGLDRLSSSSAILLYSTNAVILSISGTTVTVETSTTLTGLLTYKTCVAVGGNGMAFSWEPAQPVNATFLTISGVTITEGTYSDISSVDGNYYAAAVTLDDQTVILTYLSNITLKVRAILLYNISGGSFLIGDDIIIDDAVGDLAICRIDDTHALLAYTETGGVGYKTAVITRSGATLTAGSSTTIKTMPAVGGSSHIRIGVMSSTKAVAVYSYKSGVDLLAAARTMTISGTTITDDNNEVVINNDIDISISLSHPFALAVLQG